MTPLQGPVVDYRNFYSNRGLWTNWDVPGQPAGASAFGVQYQRLIWPMPPAGPTCRQPSARPSRVPLTWAHTPAARRASPVIANDQYDFYVYDSTNDTKVNYDHVLIVPNANGERWHARRSPTSTARTQWADVKVVLANPAGKTGGFYVKAMLFAPDLSKFSLFFTSVARSVATCTGCGYAGDFEDDLNRLFPSSTAADYAIFESGLVDADTYVEQGLMWKNAHWTYLRYILGTDPVRTVDGGTVAGMGYKPDLLMLGSSGHRRVLAHVPGAHRRPRSMAWRTRTTTRIPPTAKSSRRRRRMASSGRPSRGRCHPGARPAADGRERRPSSPPLTMALARSGWR